MGNRLTALGCQDVGVGVGGEEEDGQGTVFFSPPSIFDCTDYPALWTPGAVPVDCA